MRRVMATAAIAAAVVGCSDSKSSVSDHLAGPSYSVGEPPPPPIPGAGVGSFSTLTGVTFAPTSRTSATPASGCPGVSGQFAFTTTFFQNDPSSNTWLRILETSPATSEFRFHDVETKGHSKMDGSGQLFAFDSNGDPFTFQIQTVSGESLIPGPSTNPYHPLLVSLTLTGTLTINGQTCKNVSGVIQFTYTSASTNKST